MTLHIISVAPNQGSAFEDCLRVFDPAKDAILLLGDAVYALRSNNLAQASLNCHVHAFERDLLTRGIQITTEQAKLMSANELVNLSEQHPNSVSWA